MFGKFDPLKKKKAHVLGSNMAYVEHGKGDPIVLLHGNPTSSYLWRDVIPHLSQLGRCIAPDLIGMGDSDQIAAGANSYSLDDHAEYLEAFLDVMDVSENVRLVLHDWGGPLGFDWARRHHGAATAVAFMETIVTPLSWDDWNPESTRIFQGMRDEAGEELVLTKNVFVERILPASVIRELPADVMNVYRRPYIEAGESRRPTLSWPRQLPIDGEPPRAVEVISENERWLETSDIPKLFINADPGAILVGRQREVVRAWPNLTEVTVPGIHFIQEDSGAEIGDAVASWLQSLGSS